MGFENFLNLSYVIEASLCPPINNKTMDYLYSWSFGVELGASKFTIKGQIANYFRFCGWHMASVTAVASCCFCCVLFVLFLQAL